MSPRNRLVHEVGSRWSLGRGSAVGIGRGCSARTRGAARRRSTSPGSVSSLVTLCGWLDLSTDAFLLPRSHGLNAVCLTSRGGRNPWEPVCVPTVTPRMAGSGRPAGRGFGGAAPNIHFPARRPLAVTLRVPHTANPKIYYKAAAIAVSHAASPRGSEGGVCGNTATGSCGREREPPAHGR